jgi:hypothetical protein
MSAERWKAGLLVFGLAACGDPPLETEFVGPDAVEDRPALLDTCARGEVAQELAWICGIGGGRAALETQCGGVLGPRSGCTYDGTRLEQGACDRFGVPARPLIGWWTDSALGAQVRALLLRVDEVRFGRGVETALDRWTGLLEAEGCVAQGREASVTGTVVQRLTCEEWEARVEASPEGNQVTGVWVGVAWSRAAVCLRAP